MPSLPLRSLNNTQEKQAESLRDVLLVGSLLFVFNTHIGLIAPLCFAERKLTRDKFFRAATALLRAKIG